MNRRIPKKGDIWRDDHGTFLVVEEHPLSEYDMKANNYVCEISLFDMSKGEYQHHWTITNAVLRHLIFVA